MPIDPNDYAVTADASIVDVDLDGEPMTVNGQRVDEQRAGDIAAESLAASTRGLPRPSLTSIGRTRRR